MWTGIFTAVLSAIISLTVAIATQVASERMRRQAEARQERDRLNLTYLNPLRLNLEEAYARLRRIADRIAQDEAGTCALLLSVDTPEGLSEKPPRWFIEEGYYLVSSSYLLGCLFYHILKVKSDVPFLQMNPHDDTELLDLMRQASLSFGRKGNIYYVVQTSIGKDMYWAEGDRLLTYREFCQALQDPNRRVWFDSMLQFLLETGRGHRTEILNQALQALQDLLHFLETHLGSTQPMQQRVIPFKKQ